MRLIAGKRVQPINIDLIPSWNTVDDRLKDAPWHTVDGVHYGVPYMWGPNVLMYNTEVFERGADELERGVRGDDPADGKSNKGRVQAYDGPIHIADAALYLMYHQPELGITNPYELNEEQYEAALDLLRAAAQAGQPLLARRLHPDGRLQERRRGRLGLLAVPGQHPAEREASRSPRPSPQEGATGWADTTMMHVDAENPNCAYMWMEHSLSSNLQTDLSVWFGANPACRPPAPTGAACRPPRAAPPTAWTISRGSGSGPRRSRKCESQGECVPYYRWVSDYIGVIGGR